MKRRVNSMADTPTVSNVEKIDVKRRGFDLDKFERVSLEGSVEFTPLPKENFIQAAMELCNGSSDELYSLMNSALRRKVVMDAKNSLQPDPEKNPNWVANAKVVLNFVNNFRAMKPYNSIEDRGKQTAAIFADLKKQPEIIASLKLLAKVAADSGIEDEDENDAQ